MAVRLKTKWHRSKRSERNQRGSRAPKTLKDLSSVISINIWKLAKEAFLRMEKEGYRFRDDQQAIGTINEFIIFQIHIVDRMLYPKVEQQERKEFINEMARHLIVSVVENQQELLGEGDDYEAAFVDNMNERLSGYAECDFSSESGPNYEFLRYLAASVADYLKATDDKWVIEQVMDIEAPETAEKIMRVADQVLGLSHRKIPSPGGEG